MTRPLRLRILLLAALRIVFNTTHRMVYPFLSVFARGLGVDLATMSLAITARSIAGGIFSPLLASVADSRGRKAGMLLGLALFTGGVSLAAVWPTFPAFTAALILALVGNLVFISSMQAYLGDQVSYERRGRAMALTELSWSLAFIAGVPLVGLLIARWGWRAPFPLLAILGIAALAGLSWLLPRDPAPAEKQPSLWQNFGAVFRARPALAGLAMSLLFSAANECVNLFFGVWMEQAFALKIAALGATAIAIGLGEFGGESLVGGLTDRLGKPRAVGIGLILNSLAALGLLLMGGRLAGALAGLFLFYLTFEFLLVSSLPLMTEVLPNARATLLAMNIASISLGRAVGATLAPRLYAAWGFPATAIAAVVFNLLALLALQGVKRIKEQRSTGYNQPRDEK